MTLTLRQKEILTGIFGIVFFFGGFLASELAFRAVQYVRFGGTETIGTINIDKTGHLEAVSANDPANVAVKRSDPFYTDEISGLRLPYPNQKLGLVRINNLGFRGPDIIEKKPENTFRIAFLGSSTTYDANVPEGKNWAETTINTLRRNIIGCKIDFINAGLPGFSTNHMQKYWESIVRNYGVDSVIILPGDMTTNIQTSAKYSGHNKGQHITKSWLAKYSLLWEKVEKNIKVVTAQRSAFNPDGKHQPNIAALSGSFSSRLRNLIQAVHRDNLYIFVPTIASHVRRGMSSREQLVAADSALFYMPYITIPTLLDAQDSYNDAIRNVVIDSPAELIEDENIIPADNTHFSDSRHFSTPGSAVMGRRIAFSMLHSVGFKKYLQLNPSGCGIDNIVEDD